MPARRFGTPDGSWDYRQCSGESQCDDGVRLLTKLRKEWAGQAAVYHVRVVHRDLVKTAAAVALAVGECGL